MNSLLEKICKFKFDKTYCISLKNRKDRQKNVIKECLKIGLDFEFLLVQKHTDPVRGCLESHIKCIEDAIKHNYENILVMEDDISFDIESINKIIEENTIKIPDLFDILYLGYHINNGHKYSNNIIKALSTQTTHCYVMNKRVFQFIIDTIEKDWTTIPEYSERTRLERLINWNIRAIDLYYAKWINHRRSNSYAIYPILCYQYANHSDIEGREIDYRNIMKQKADTIYRLRSTKGKALLSVEVPDKILPKVEPVIEEKIQESNDLFNFDVKKTFMINLDRRKDRWTKMENLFKTNNINTSQITRFGAVDGRTYDFSSFLRLFTNIDLSIIKNPYPSHEFKKGVLGCALSHYKVWTFINAHGNDDEDIFLVLEDDIEFTENFKEKYNNIRNQLSKDNDWGITFLGFTDDKDINGDIMKHEEIKQFCKHKRLNGGGTFAYLIKKRAANRLIEIADTDGIRQAIDWFMIEQFDKVVSYVCKPTIIKSLAAHDGNTDSDVQNLQSKTNPARKPDAGKLIIDNILYYKDVYRNLFKFNIDNTISYVGELGDNMKINRDVILNQEKVQLNLLEKPTIFIYCGDTMTIMTINLAETLVEAFNVIVYCQSPNVRINSVFYLHYSKFAACIKVIKPVLILVTDLTFFLSYSTNNYKLIVWEQNPFKRKQWNGIPLPNNGRELLFNVSKIIHKIVCSCTLHKIIASKTMLISDNSLSIIPYFSKEIYNSLCVKKTNQFMCLDNLHDLAIKFFKKIREKNKDAKLILFNKEIEETEGIEVRKTESRNEIYKTLFESEYFINFENYNECYYNVLMAIKANTCCIINKTFEIEENKPWIIIEKNSTENFEKCNKTELLKNMKIFIKKFNIKNTAQKWVEILVQ